MYMKHVCVLQIALRSMKSIELRVGGSVEPPNVDISVVSFCVCLCVDIMFMHTLFFLHQSRTDKPQH